LQARFSVPLPLTQCSHADDDGTGYSGHHKIALSANGDTILRWWRSLHRWRSPPPKLAQNHCQNRGQLQSPSFHSIQKNGYGETVESCDKKRQVGSANLMDKNAMA